MLAFLFEMITFEGVPLTHTSNLLGPILMLLSFGRMLTSERIWTREFELRFALALTVCVGVLGAGADASWPACGAVATWLAREAVAICTARGAGATFAARGACATFAAHEAVAPWAERGVVATWAARELVAT